MVLCTGDCKVTVNVVSSPMRGGDVCSDLEVAAKLEASKRLRIWLVSSAGYIGGSIHCLCRALCCVNNERGKVSVYLGSRSFARENWEVVNWEVGSPEGKVGSGSCPELAARWREVAAWFDGLDDTGKYLFFSSSK